MDGDARGGAAPLGRCVVGVPIAFIGARAAPGSRAVHPDRVVSRVLGMGDVLSLIEKAEEACRSRMRRSSRGRSGSTTSRWRIFAINSGPSRRWDRRADRRDAAGMGNLKGTGGQSRQDRRQVARSRRAIINSMTPQERRNHQVINGSRRKRIAKGSARRRGDQPPAEAVRADEEDAQGDGGWRDSARNAAASA